MPKPTVEPMRIAENAVKGILSRKVFMRMIMRLGGVELDGCELEVGNEQ